MKNLTVLAILVVTFTLIACGGGSSPAANTNPASGSWAETLNNTTGQQLGSFTFDITQNNTNLTGSTMNFANMGSLDQCFGTGTAMSGQMGQGMMNGGTMTMSISWTGLNGAGTNTMMMNGTMAMGMGSGSGTFTLTGQTPGCMSDTGTFAMTHKHSMM